MNGTVVKNQLIFDFASGILGPAKSLFASTYLQLNSNASKISNTFENMLGENLMDNENIQPKNLKYTDCIDRANSKPTSNIKDPVTKYLPELSGSNYDKISIKHILQMSSGIKWNEDYEDPYSDVNLAAGLNSSDLYKYLSKLDIAHKPGRKFNYNTAESNLIGGIVRSAVGSNLSNYLESKIWKPFGMESDAHWALDNTFLDELGGCCIYATLKDYTRIGIFALKQGKLLNGTEVLPKKWIRDSTKASKAYRHYGYQWWLSGPPYKSYYAQGIFGQMIWIDPPTETVIVIQSASDKAWTPEADQHKFALLTAIMIKLYNL